MEFPKDFYCSSKEYATFEKHIPAPCFRKRFDVENIEKASIIICGIGFYELFVNGQRITRGRLSSYISNPDKVLYYDEYNVTDYINHGENVIAVLLGNGFLNCVGGGIWDFDKTPYRSSPKFALQFTMGDLTFRAKDFVTAPSPIIFDDMRAGEWYDARLESGDITAVSYDDSGWTPTLKAECPRGVCRLNTSTPMTVQNVLHPISYRKSKISIFPEVSVSEIPYAEDEKNTEGILYDFGINTSGVCKLKLKNTCAGQKIILQYGEILGDNPKGERDTTERNENSGLDLRGFHFLPSRYNHRDVYICKGGERETFEPTFTHHGFRYCLVMGLDEAQIQKDTVQAVVFHTDLEQIADFKCSDDMVNRLWKAGLRSDLTNFCHFPTDCPHREKNGWTGDAQLSAEQMLTAFSCETNLKEWLYNLQHTMRMSGEPSGIAPTAGWGYGIGPAWDAALIEIPYQIWRMRGDAEVIKENMAPMFHYIQFLSSKRSAKGLIEYGLGDWCQAARIGVDNPKASAAFTSTVIAMDICCKASAMFEAIGFDAEAQYAKNISAKLRLAGRKHLVDPVTMTTFDRCQTTQAMAIYYGLFDDCEKGMAFDVLLRLIHNNGDFFDCGILGMRVLFHVLSEFGHTDLALHMITRAEFPSYGYWINNGATTFWELFSPIEQMQSSCNHHFFGDVLSWFIKNLAGICHNPYDDNVNFVVIAPHFPSTLDYATASVKIPAGTVKCSWKREGDFIILDTDIPEGTEAVLRLDDTWQTENGFGQIKLYGESQIKIISSGTPDILKKIAN